MNIKLAWNFWFDLYQDLFPEIELFDWKKSDRTEQIDLLVFPGGDDVSLEYYSGRDDMEKFRGMCYTNRERDDYEFNLLDACFDKRLSVKKILGVCRGVQLLNVAFDGNLYQDLDTYGIGHSNIHEILHKANSNLSFIKEVNSLHHQGIKGIGKYNRMGDRSYPTIIATDRTGLVPEIVTWCNDRILGVQFHPEYYWSTYADKIKFKEFCYSWINGTTTILK